MFIVSCFALPFSKFILHVNLQPIEPDEQTALIDETLKIPGVIAALVPGAGGYDAIACLYLNHPSVRHAIADFWCSWPKASVCPLTVQGARYGEGIRIESEES